MEALPWHHINYYHPFPSLTVTMDPEAIENTLSKDAEHAEGPKIAQHDDKTDELVNSLESEVDKAYNSIQESTINGISKFQALVNGKLPELQKQWNDVKISDVKLPEVKLPEVKLPEKLDTYLNEENINNLKLKSNEILNKYGENTNKVLDSLDNDLEKIENMTIEYAQQIGGQIGSFFKPITTSNNTEKSENSTSSWNWSSWGKQLSELVVGESPESVLSKETKSELLFSLPQGISPGTRAESQVHELQSDSSLYLSSVKDGLFKDYKLTDDETKEISQLSSNDSLHLMQVFKKVVKSNEEATDASVEVDKISEDDFWKVYFGKRAEIIKDEQKRRELLSKSTSEDNEEDEEEFNWDDE